MSRVTSWRSMRIFWQRHAFPRRPRGWNWSGDSRNGEGSRHYSASACLVFFIILSIFLLVMDGWVDLSSKYGEFPTQNAIQNISGKNVHLDCAAWNHTQTCSTNYPVSHKPSKSPLPPPATCPEYFRWIHEDLKHWKTTGISKQAVEKARKTAHFRLVISRGKVYVEKFRDSIQTRALFTMWGFVQLVRLYPGKLPDLELMFDCDDRPVIGAKNLPAGSEPPPLFRYCSDRRSLDIVFPDWSFWGWAETNVRPWRTILKEIKEGNKRIQWEDRVPYAYWRGNPHVCPWRGDLMKCNVTPENDWNTRLYVQDWVAESQQGYKQSNISDQCTHRYKIYIEGWAWSVSEKYILACNSATLLMTLHWYDFFVRGMIPQHHYWPVREDDKCRSLKFAVEWGNNHTQKAKAIGKAGSRFIHEDLKMEYVYDYMFHLLNQYAKLLKYKPEVPPNAVGLCSESLACSAEGIWGKFMEESMEKYPSDSPPCRMPPAYEPQELEAFVNDKEKAMKEVEAWENDFWNKQKSPLVNAKGHCNNLYL